jgi:DNA-binding NtrC family response regulator
VAKVLLVDDDPGVLFTLGEVLSSRGHDVVRARSGAEALPQLDVDVVVTDLAMPGMDGMELLAAIRERDPALPVIMITAHGSERTAVAAMRAGAYDYLHKPFAVDEVALVVARAAEARELRATTRSLRVERAAGGAIVGRSPKFAAVVDEATRIAARDVTVLIRGETGTGKELIATLIHAASPRAKGPLIRFNCAAIAPELADAELFGHTRGAFTGATSARRGFVQEAHGGTLVLDEVGELPMSLQAKLLRVVQGGEVQPVGASRVDKVDVRIVACTHRDLRSPSFREDLYYRLAVVELVIPPLRERREDLPLLIEEFRARYARRFGLGEVRFTDALIAALSSRAWPGNVRELENAVARILALATTDLIDVDALARLTNEPASDPNAPLRDQVGAFERGILLRTLEAAGWNQSEAARRLAITRVTLIDKMKRHSLRKN